MSTDDFRREFLGQFPAPDPKYVRAVELWTLYHLACDAFYVDARRGREVTEATEEG